MYVTMLQLSTQLGAKVEGSLEGNKANQQTLSGTDPMQSNEFLDGTAGSLAAVRQSRTTSELLNWADDIAAISSSLTGNASISAGDLNDPDLVNALAHIVEDSHAQQMTSSQAAAKALLKAARNNSHHGRSKTTASRYMESEYTR